MAAAAILKNRKIAICWPQFDRFPPNLARQRSSALLSALAVKISKNKNPRWWWSPSWKIEKLPYLGRDLTEFDQVWHTDADQHFWALRPLKILNLKIQDGGSRHLEKSSYFGRDLTDFDQIWYGDAVQPLSLIHIWRCRRIERCRSRWSPYH